MKNLNYGNTIEYAVLRDACVNWLQHCHCHHVTYYYFAVGYIDSMHWPVYCRVTIFSISAINSEGNVSFNFELQYNGSNVENTTTNTRILMYKPLEKVNGSYAVVVCIKNIFKNLKIFIQMCSTIYVSLASSLEKAAIACCAAD